MPKPSKTYSKLSDFIENKMRMSHIYQPVMLAELLKQNGAASGRCHVVEAHTSETPVQSQLKQQRSRSATRSWPRT
jgi:hypothetical protein